MELSSLQILDTAVKIGLGSIITLFGTYLVTKINHNHEYRKDKNNRFFNSMEEISSLIEDTTHISLKYWALVNEWTSKKANFKLYREEELKKVEVELFHSFKNLTVAESKLMLLGLKEESILLREYGMLLSKLRSNFFKGNNEVTLESMKQIREEILNKRESLFFSLSQVYSGKK